MVALVRGVHGLNGAVRAEVLTDRPEDRFVAGAVLYREGDGRPLTIASAEAVADGPGWRLRFREVTTRDARRRPSWRVSRIGRPAGRGPGPRVVLLARGHRLCRSRHRWRGARHGQGHLPGRRDRGVHRRRRRLWELRPAGRPRIHPDLRSAPRRDRGRRRVARSASGPVAHAGSGSSQGTPSPEPTWRGSIGLRTGPGRRHSGRDTRPSGRGSPIPGPAEPEA